MNAKRFQKGSQLCSRLMLLTGVSLVAGCTPEIVDNPSEDLGQVSEAVTVATNYKIKANRNGKYLMLDATKKVVHTATTAGQGETFYVESGGTGLYKFKATSNGKYLVVNADGTMQATGNTAADGHAFGEQACNYNGSTNGYGYSSATGTAKYWKAQDDNFVKALNNGNGAQCSTASGTSWERFFMEPATAAPLCGNNNCEGGETCDTCAGDCGACAPVCGNGQCQSGETCTSCPADCGACSGGTCASNDLTTAGNLVTTSSPSQVTAASGAFDNNVGTRWESAHNLDPQWLQVDLGAKKKITRVRIDWETAGAKDYRIEASDDGTNWTPVTSRSNMASVNHRIDDLTGLNSAGRYVRVYGTARNTVYGYSVWEMDVYGDNNASCGTTPPPAVCGDATCQSNETCSTCAADCGTCAPVCGNATCESGESCSSCAGDCGACAAACGDGACNGTETCSNCATDCGACATGRNIGQNLQAETYDLMSGVQYEACSEGEQNAGWIDANDFIEWKIQVPSTGNYYV
ncbi:MAG TPA: discoidin domain-containing protein, partial [Polyangiaceae bacterium]|nr:discoidin domain-containing protein [Polyangiaceae bacterium]